MPEDPLKTIDQIDATLDAHAREVEQICQAYLDEALAGLFDLLDNSIDVTPAISQYSPSLRLSFDEAGQYDKSDPRRWLQLLTNVHDPRNCVTRPCTLHNPTQHAMSTWPLRWRRDRKIFERICGHGVGHPDPDQFGFWQATRQEWQSVHGCDGCCVTD